jgi:hypothetical protein
MEKLARHSSLLQKFVSYRCKKIIRLAPCLRILPPVQSLIGALKKKFQGLGSNGIMHFELFEVEPTENNTKKTEQNKNYEQK